MQKKKHSGEELYGELGKAFNFTQGDLEANRAGFLSHRQRKIQMQRFRVWFFQCVVFGLVSLCPGLFALSMFSQFDYWGLGTQATAIVMSLITIFGLVLIFGGVYDSIQFYSDLSKGRVKRLSGQVSYHPIRGGLQRIPTFTYRIANEIITLEDNHYALVISNQPCDMYVYSDKNKILSVEKPDKFED